jgi:hypothetical protein
LLSLFITLDIIRPRNAIFILWGDEMIRRLLTFLIFAVLFSTLTGCSTTPRQSTELQPDALDIQFEMVPSTDVYIPNVEAKIVGDKVTIQGVVRRKPGNCCDTTKGIISVSVLAPNGDVFDEVDIAHTPRNIPSARKQSSRFITHLPYILPDKFILKIEYLRS